MGRPRCTQESLGGHFEGNQSGGESGDGWVAGSAGQWLRESAVPAEAELRAWGGIGVVQSRELACPSWRRGSGHWSPGVGTGALEPTRGGAAGRARGGRVAGAQRLPAWLRPPASSASDKGRKGRCWRRLSLGVQPGSRSTLRVGRDQSAGASPALALPGFCPLGPLDCQSLVPTSQSGQGSPILTVVCLAAVLRALYRRVSYGNLERNC